MLHRFLISEDIHVAPDNLAPRDCGYAFCISTQSCDISPISACIRLMLGFYLKLLDTRVGMEVGE